ncbi:MAG: DUF3368 domain-containing protein [Bacteroidetes bacterium]|nr:DUF3368 domain-containing protein [Bacteroidota bacterium]
MLVISDCSTITNLIQIGELAILKKLFKEIIIPDKVYEELAIYENQKDLLDLLDWIAVKSVSNQNAVSTLAEILDPGEAEAIVLAEELKADFLIIDERKGRKVAEDRGIKIVGLLGILIQAKKARHIAQLKPLLDRLIHTIGFRVSKKLYDRILSQAGE